jgi:hypothetical protein
MRTCCALVQARPGRSTLSVAAKVTEEDVHTARTALPNDGDSLELPLATSGLSVGVGSIKPTEPRLAEGDSLQLPLATAGLAVGVGGIKPPALQATTGDLLQLPLATSGLAVGVGFVKRN